ncbi:hypothetical protein [Spelaeicoccus albus]|uniref:Uncharacterized protein n=2 Tax=Spelaeicoccus albus TaxID=1280376 RepID=A0A7Z0IHC0_9MICO|nr:hypothetical protein [Spelaeicoccus albus]
MLGSGLWRAGGRLILLPLLATIAVCALVLAIISAAFAANAAPAAARPEATAPADARPAPGGPTFEVAVASTDKPVVMADFVKADDASTSFGDMFVQSLRTSPRVSDFASLEHEYSPKAAARRVTSGEAVLAVIVGPEFSSTFRRNMVSALHGGAVRQMPITVVAGPQALADNKLILHEYRKQAIKPTLDYLADEMRIVVKKSGCDVPNTAPGRCISVTDAMLDKFAAPFHTTVRTVDGPAAQSYDYPSMRKQGARGPVHHGAPPAGPATSASPAPAMEPLAVVLVLIVVAALVAATTTAWAVDFRLGRAVFTTGPWRRQNAQMPFPRRKALMVQNAAGVVVGVLSSSVLVGVYLARSGRLGQASVTIQAGNVLVWSFAVLITVALVAFVQALEAVVGTPGWLVSVVAVVGFALPAAGIGALLTGEPAADGAFVRAACGLAGRMDPSAIAETCLPIAVVLLAVAAVSFGTGRAVSGAYDKYVTSSIAPPN